MKSLLFLILGLLSFSCTSRLAAPPTTPATLITVQTDSGEKWTLPLEEYVVGVLFKEVPTEWPKEALKAQAVAIRSFALFRKGQPRSVKKDYDLEGSIMDQVFEKKETYPEKLLQAVKETEGETLQYQGKILPSFFHSHCGGISEGASSVWSGEFSEPLNQVHPDPFCADAPNSSWTYLASPAEVGGEIEVNERNGNGRIQHLVLHEPQGTIHLPGNNFRQKIGFTKIRSTLFEMEQRPDGILFSGRGYGHGVGLCQWGAKGMAELGYTYQEILEFYYPGAELWRPHSSPTTSP